MNFIKHLILSILTCATVTSCDYFFDMVFGNEEHDSEYTYSKDYIENAHSVFFKDGSFVIFTPDSLSGYYICIDSLDFHSGSLVNDPFYAQCDSLMRPMYAAYQDVRLFFANYSENTFDLNVYIGEECLEYKNIGYNVGATSTKASTEGSTNLDRVGDALGILGIASETVLHGPKGFIIETTKFIGIKLLSNKAGEYGPFVGWTADIVGIIMDPKNKLGIVGLTTSGIQAMEASAELYSGIRIGDINPYITTLHKQNHNSIKVVFETIGYSSQKPDVPIATIHYRKDKEAWKQGKNHHINGSSTIYEESFSDLESGKYEFRCIVYPSQFINHPLLQQYYGFISAISKIDIAPLYMSELSLQSTTKQDDLIMASIKIKLDFLSERDKDIIDHSFDYGVCIIQDGKKDLYSAKDPNNADNEFYITLNLPLSDFIEIEDEKYQYNGDLKFCTYYTSYGIKQFRDEKTLTITYPYEDRWVDLGLPSGILWAAYNVGANSPEEYGGYYAWGETEEKESYTWENYWFNNPSTGDFDFIGNEISGTSYDVAHVQWGGGARMPTLTEVKELVNNCTFKYGTYNGVKGHYVTGPNGNSIFLPFAGSRDRYGLYSEGNNGYFWSGTFNYYNYDDCACYLKCGKDYSTWGGDDRRHGRSVRPVTEK